MHYVDISLWLSNLSAYILLCFRIMYYNLYLNIYNFPNILYPINTSCNTIILYKSNNTTSPFLSYIE